jgi:hypothetical protein
MGHKSCDDNIGVLLRDLAITLEAGFADIFGEHTGFFLLVFPFNEKGRADYISNANRSDAIKVLRETADRLGRDLGR